MADIESKVYAALSGNAALAALVSTRIYPLQFPQGVTVPALTYERISTERQYSLTGYSGIEQVGLQVMVLASTYAQARQVSDAVVSAMEGAAAFQALLDTGIDIYQDEVGQYGTILDFGVWHHNSE
jgi:phage tail protein X